MAKLREVLKNYIGKYIKLGASAGFFFCGYIHEDFEEMLKEVLNIEADKVNRQLAKTQAMLDGFAEYWENRGKKYVPTSYTPTQVKYRKDAERIEITLRLKRLKEQKEKIYNILDDEVIDEYKSKIDPSFIIIIDRHLVGNIDDRKSMMAKPLYKDIVAKYNI